MLLYHNKHEMMTSRSSAPQKHEEGEENVYRGHEFVCVYYMSCVGLQLRKRWPTLHAFLAD